jgi:radical SAM protein with 4Fe4S-binding SPASM domain
MNLRYIFKEANYYRKVNGLTRAIKKFLLSQTFFSRIVNTEIYNFFYAGIIKRKISSIRPRILQIENTNLCNARCIMCPHRIMKREKKVMDLASFKKIVENVLKYEKIERLTISGFGEPFLDVNFLKKIDFINEKYPDLKIDIYTNASMLTRELTDNLLRKKIDRITFSINGTEKNYGEIMGLNYGKTKSKVLYFLERKKKTKSKLLCNISLVIIEENEKDVSNFIKFWSPLADSVRAYVPSDWAGALKNVKIISKKRLKKRRWPCFVLWNTVTVDVKGNVIMCCRDYESNVKFGNLLKNNIKEIRESKKFKILLDKQARGNYFTPVCAACDNSFDSSLDWIC